MRIALTQKKKTWTGQTLCVWRLAVDLRERGHETFLVAPHRPDEIADELLRLLQDGALRERLAAAAHKSVTERFARDRYLDATERVYAMVLHH